MVRNLISAKEKVPTKRHVLQPTTKGTESSVHNKLRPQRNNQGNVHQPTCLSRHSQQMGVS